MKEYKHIGAYGIVLKNNKILLIKKKGGPYDGKLDLPGGTIEFKERPGEALVRELKEEVGIDVVSFNLLDVDSTNVVWNHKGEDQTVHHIALFYKINEYKNEIKRQVEITEINDDSMGAQFYNINDLTQNQLSSIANLILSKMGYIIK